MFFVLSVKFSSFVLPLFPFPFLHSFLSFLCFFHFSLSLSFFLSFVYSVRFYFLLASFLASLLPSFTPPFFLFSCLLSSFLPRIPFFLPSFQFFSFCPVSSLETLAFRGALFSDKWLQIVYLRDIFAIYLLGDIDVSNYFYLDEERRRTQHISHLSRGFFFKFRVLYYQPDMDLLWWVFSSSIMILLRSTVPCSTSSRCVWLYPHLCCELLSSVGPTA